jgi:activating signal cointegrator complex subunit 3
LTKNPTFYNLEGGNADAIQKYLNSLVSGNLMKLKDAGCVELEAESDSIASTQLGYLCSFYYLSHLTVQHMNKSLTENNNIESLIDILSKVQEFKGLPVRHNEDILNEALSHLVPLKVNKHMLESPFTKANLLLQAHFDRCPLPITDFITDSKSVID